MSAEPLFDVVAVNLRTGAERVIARRETEDNAEATVRMAVFRRGVEVEFFKAVAHEPSGSDSEGGTPE